MSDILEIVKDQPKPLLFFKSCQDLNGSNLTNYLTFDSRSITELLDSKNEEFFKEDYPLFYKNKFTKPWKKKPDSEDANSKVFYTRFALESCFKVNQVRAVTCILEYVSKYQNNYTTSYQLRKVMPQVIGQGLSIKHLLESQIFNYEFDFDTWPSNHTSGSEEIRPYNSTIFDVVQHYKNVFPESEFDEIDNHNVKKNQVVYKIRYSLNLLPSMGQYYQPVQDNESKFEVKNQGVNFLQLCNSSDELEMFET